jgi:hypothetical protein
MASWKVAEAKAHFSELIDNALREGGAGDHAPRQARGVVVWAKEWDRRAARKESLLEFPEKSPLKGSGLELERLRARSAVAELRRLYGGNGPRASDDAGDPQGA